MDLSYEQLIEPIADISQKELGTGFVQIVTRDSAKLNNDPGLLLLMNSMKLINNPQKLVNRIISLNHRTHSNKILYAPGIATANNLAILSYLGVDMFDTTQCILHAHLGNLMTNSGMFPKDVSHDLISSCGCLGCSRSNDNAEDSSKILIHNISTLNSELAIVKSSIAQGKLRELVEQRMVTDPGLSTIIRTMDQKYYKELEPIFPIFRPQKYLACSREALERIEVKRFQNRIRDRYTKPVHTNVLLLLPCSAKKPYSESKSHKLFKQAINSSSEKISDLSMIHEVIITSPLGLVPREFELVYPAQQYDIPVTGHWFEDELIMIKNCLLNYLKENLYEQIVIHLSVPLGDHIEQWLNTLFSDKNYKSEIKSQIYRTNVGNSTSKESLDKLTHALHDILDSIKSTEQYKPDHKNSYYLDVLKAISTYQFGPSGLELLKDVKIRGKYPYLKIFRENDQLGMLTGERGYISLTLSGAKELLKQLDFNHKVLIDDFVPKGSIMAIGVQEASKEIRIGDDVVACFGDSVRAVGQAVMSGPEMELSTRGVAVKVRHHV
jgi:archaeosine synthase